MSTSSAIQTSQPGTLAIADAREIGELLKKFPVEVLGLIFCSASGASDSNSEFPVTSLRDTPFNIAHVSRAWRALALSIPKLWTKITLRTSTPRMFEFLEVWAGRAGSLPLAIKISGRAWESASNNRIDTFRMSLEMRVWQKEQLPALKDWMNRLRHRIQHVSLHLGMLALVPLYDILKDLSSLRTLGLYHVDEYHTGVQDSIIQTVNNFRIDLSPFSNLRDFGFKGPFSWIEANRTGPVSTTSLSVDCPSSTLSQQMRDINRLFPRIRDLSITCHSTCEGFGVEPGGQSPNVLANLERLEVIDGRGRLDEVFNGLPLLFVRLRSLTIRSRYDNTTKPAFQSIRSLSTVTRIEELDLHLTYHHDVARNQEIQQLLAALPWLRKLRIGDAVLPFEGAHWACLTLSGLTCFESTKIDDDGNPVRAGAYGTPEEPLVDGGSYLRSTTLLCPHLEELECTSTDLGASFDPFVISDMLLSRRRYRMTSTDPIMVKDPDSKMMVPTRPVYIKKVRLMCPGFVKALRRMARLQTFFSEGLVIEEPLPYTMI